MNTFYLYLLLPLIAGFQLLKHEGEVGLSKHKGALIYNTGKFAVFVVPFCVSLALGFGYALFQEFTFGSWIESWLGLFNAIMFILFISIAVRLMIFAKMEVYGQQMANGGLDDPGGIGSDDDGGSDDSDMAGGIGSDDDSDNDENKSSTEVSEWDSGSESAASPQTSKDEMVVDGESKSPLENTDSDLTSYRRKGTSSISFDSTEDIVIPVKSVFGGTRVFLAIALVVLLIIPGITPLMGGLEYNPIYSDLQETVDNTDDAQFVLEDAQEARVISWNLATEYLQRSYGDAASSLNADEWGMMDYTHPTLVNGEFVWVNAPRFEEMKWFGAKEIPFYVTVANDPANMSSESFEPVMRSSESFSVQTSQITWENRIDQALNKEYALKYVVEQVRFDIDDEYNPYWVVYLGERGIYRDVVTMKKILIINAQDIDDRQEYDVDSDEIPDWLEVVYPEYNVEDWARLWGSWREGIMYNLFTKTHLSTPSDSARFVVLEGQTFWYVPMVQLSSDVLAGYILVDTRTGEAVYHNREAKSLASLNTAWLQISAYLSSGAEGFNQLRIDEGYLYPIRTDSGEVREAYIFPLYSGFSIQRFAIVDAEDYTQTPLLEDSLDLALLKYKAKGAESNASTFVWQNVVLENGYCEADECVITYNGTTKVVSEGDLSGGAISQGADEWRELKLAISEFDRTGNVSIQLVEISGIIGDIDYAGSNLVTRN